MNPSWGNNQNFRIGTFFGFVKQFATKFTQRFGVDFPIVGSPMTLSITTPKFVSSVGSTGCLSFIGTGDIVNSDVSRIPVGVIQNDYKKAKSLAGPIASSNIGIGINIVQAVKDPAFLESILRLDSQQPLNLWIGGKGINRTRYKGNEWFADVIRNRGTGGDKGKYPVNSFCQVNNYDDAMFVASLGVSCVVVSRYKHASIAGKGRVQGETSITKNINPTHITNFNSKSSLDNYPDRWKYPINEDPWEHEPESLSRREFGELIQLCRRQFESQYGNARPLIIAAGGLTNGSDLLWALNAGSDAIALGTRLAATQESGLALNLKLKLLQSYAPVAHHSLRNVNVSDHAQYQEQRKQQGGNQEIQEVGDRNGDEYEPVMVEWPTYHDSPKGQQVISTIKTKAFKTKGDNHDSKTTIDDIIDSEEMQQIEGDDFMSSKKTGKGVKEKGKSTYPSPQYVYRFFDDRHLHDEDALLHLSDLNPNLERAEHDKEEHDKYYPSSAPSRSASSNDAITMNEYKEVDVAGGGDTYHVYIGGPKEESSSSTGNSTSNNNEMEMEINRRKNMSLAEVDLPTVEDVILVSYVTLYFTQNFIDFINCNQAKIEGYSHIEIFDSFIRNS